MKTEGTELGVDVGMNKLMTCSDGKMLGTEMKVICQKIRRKKPGSKAKQRACSERKCYINRAVKQLPWNEMKLIAIEDLKGIKTGKQKNIGCNYTADSDFVGSTNILMRANGNWREPMVPVSPKS